jgi:hypothetical protein
MNFLQSSFFRWLPRILALCYAIFLSLFATDVFDEKLGFWPTAADLGMHLIPTFIVLIVLVLAWRREWIGASLYAALAVFYSCWALPKHPLWAELIAGPLLLIAVVYLLAWLGRRAAKQSQ